MDRLLKLLTSYKATITLLLVYAIGLATATLLEKQMGTEAAKMLIYYSPLFILLQFLLVLNFILILIRQNFIKRKRWAMVVVHLALVVILAGALVTFLFGKEGQIHIREGEKADTMMMNTSKGIKTERMPFVLELAEFRIIRYPGSESPSSYESDLLIHINGEVREVKLFMNNVLDLEGYRFFQASYDHDEKGTLLSVNSDVAGRTITYTGYLILVFGFILMFILPGSHFRKLARQLKETRGSARKTVMTLIMVLITTVSQGQELSGSHMMEEMQQNTIPQEHAARFGALPVQFHGRVMPMNTFSSEILRKIYKKPVYGNLNSDQFLLSLIAQPQMWMQVPVISMANEQISDRYNLPVEHVAYYHFFDHRGDYRLLPQLQEIYHKPAGERSTFDKDLIKLDERVNILYQLFNGAMPGIFPNPHDSSHTWYAPGGNLSVFNKKDSLFITNTFAWYLSEVTLSLSSGDWSKPGRVLDLIEEYQQKNDKASLINPKKLEAEIRYNRLNIFNRCKEGYFIFGGILLMLAFMLMLNERKWIRYAAALFIGGTLLVFLIHIYGMGMRWYISGYAPWSNSYETMVYVAWVTVLVGFIFGRKSTITLALATLFGGIILFVSGLNWMDPQIDTLVPVLKSPWLMFHVAVIVGAYGFFGISFLLGITNLLIMTFTKKSMLLSYRIRELTIINNLSLLAGLVLMATGTFLGAVWANESWGRYWGWDPKETWALITIVVYTIVTHLHLVKKWNNEWIFNLLSVFAFSSVLMTFLGVNYFLSGMHSYGQTESTTSVFLYIAIAFLMIGILGIISYRKRTIFKQDLLGKVSN